MPLKTFATHWTNSKLLLIGFVLLTAALSLFHGLWKDFDSVIFFEFRLPRTLVALSVGAGLALSGCILQSLFSNPLCEPYTLGVSSGAALGAVIASTYFHHAHLLGMNLGALVGALFFALFLSASANRHDGRNTVLVLGVLLSLLGASLVAVWTQVFNDQGMQSAVYWLMGDLSRVRLQGAIVMSTILFLGAVFTFRYWKEMDAFSWGEELGRSFGVSARTHVALMIVIVSVLTSLCVSGSGIIGFVGLLVPHLSRKCVGFSHRQLLPHTALLGAGLLVAADFGAQVFFQPMEMPVGVVTALLGSPLLIWFILSERSVFKVQR